jgi:hypothetical protein
MTPPPLFRCLARYLALDEAQAHTWWRALAAARWSVAVEWRRALLYCDQRLATAPPGLEAVDGAVAFIGTVASPAQTLAVLEALVQEQRLSRQDARGMEDKILVQTDQHGCWK